MKKSMISILVVVALLLTSLVTPVVGAVANVAQPSKMLTKEAFKHQIDTLEKGLRRAADGTLSLTVSPAVQSELGLSDEDVQNFQAGLESINKRVKKGELATTKNFTIYETNDTAFTIQGGIDATINMWWGVRHYFCTSCAAYQAYWATNSSYAAGGVAAIAAEIVPFSVIMAVTCAWLGIYGNSLAYVNSQTSRGVISDVQYTLYFSNYPQ
jgi:hypothetical protein